jgi:hypothetical protein
MISGCKCPSGLTFSERLRPVPIMLPHSTPAPERLVSRTLDASQWHQCGLSEPSEPGNPSVIFGGCRQRLQADPKKPLHLLRLLVPAHDRRVARAWPTQHHIFKSRPNVEIHARKHAWTDVTFSNPPHWKARRRAGHQHPPTRPRLSRHLRRASSPGAVRARTDCARAAALEPPPCQ